MLPIPALLAGRGGTSDRPKRLRWGSLRLPKHRPTRKARLPHDPSLVTGSSSPHFQGRGSATPRGHRPPDQPAWGVPIPDLPTPLLQSSQAPAQLIGGTTTPSSSPPLSSKMTAVPGPFPRPQRPFHLGSRLRRASVATRGFVSWAPHSRHRQGPRPPPRASLCPAAPPRRALGQVSPASSRSPTHSRPVTGRSMSSEVARGQT